MKQEQTKLTKEQKEAVGLLSIGTILEYFDLMLYVHMAVLLNELFFPKTDPFTTSLISAFSFCSSYLFRPFGALFFGWIGDHLGRKITVTITIFMMAISCFTIATLSPYASIGITASWIITICRIIQGMACIGESTGSELYIIEITKPPIQYPVVALLTVFSAIGTSIALGVANLAIKSDYGWRIAFLFGACIALIGVLARSTLRETPDFVDAKRRIQKATIKAKENPKLLEKHPIWKEKTNTKTMLAFFFMQCTRPICFYFAYVHCGNILKNMNISPEEIISHNFIISIIDFLGLFVLAGLSYKIYPLKILKIKFTLFFIFLLASPFLLARVTNSFHLGIIQSIAVLFAFDDVPAGPILYKYFPVLKRFTYASLLHAFARAMMYFIISFGLVYLTKYFNTYALLIISLPISVGYIFGVYHFEKLEKDSKNYLKKNEVPLVQYS